jgi:hypothetical protein
MKNSGRGLVVLSLVNGGGARLGHEIQRRLCWTDGRDIFILGEGDLTVIKNLVELFKNESGDFGNHDHFPPVLKRSLLN